MIAWVSVCSGDGVATDWYLALLFVGLGSTFLFHSTFPEWFSKTNAIFGELWFLVAEINICQLKVGFVSLHEWILRELPLWKELRSWSVIEWRFPKRLWFEASVHWVIVLKQEVLLVKGFEGCCWFISKLKVRGAVVNCRFSWNIVGRSLHSGPRPLFEVQMGAIRSGQHSVGWSMQ